MIKPDPQVLQASESSLKTFLSFILHLFLPIYIVYLPNRHLSANVFVDWMVELFEQEQIDFPSCV